VLGYAQLLARLARDRGLPPFERTAIARLVELGARLAGDREQLSTRYPEIADVATEAANHAGKGIVGAAHVEHALRDIRRRSDGPEQRLRELTLEGTLRIDVTGAAVGQVNGLAVADLGDLRFGHPMRVSATVAPGDGDVVDIDREAELSGPLHDKGVLILTSLLRHLYCAGVPLALRASLVFEQSYGPVEGDSGSAAELFAVVSALADAPIDQRFAVTGSVDQRGRLQAIGGVNEKIEGFFELCRAGGLEGVQGVLIPTANVRHLMLDPDVVAAAEAGTFHVWPVATVDEGLQLLTGLPATVVHERAEARLAEFAEVARRYRAPSRRR
jgi:predicted ATP-dependent protease